MLFFLACFVFSFPRHSPCTIFKGSSFLSCAATPSRPLPKTQPLQVPFPLQKIVRRFQQDRGFGEVGGGDREKEGGSATTDPVQFQRGWGEGLLKDKSAIFSGVRKGWFPKGCCWRMFPGTKNRNEGTFGCSPAPKPGTREHSDVPR